MELDKWVTEEFDINRNYKLALMKHLIKENEGSRPYVVHEFIINKALWFTCEEAWDFCKLVGNKGHLVYEVFFSRCVDLYRIKEFSIRDFYL